MYHEQSRIATYVSRHEKIYGYREKPCFCKECVWAFIWTLQSQDSGPGHHRSHENATHRTGRPRLIPAACWAGRLSPPVRSPFTILRMLCEALRESLAAHRHYEELRSKALRTIRRATVARTRSRAARSGCEAAHAVVVCGQGIERRLRLLVLADERDHGAMLHAET